VKTEGKGVVFNWNHDDAARWWVVQSKFGDHWSVTAVLEGAQTQVSLSNPPEVAAIRGVSAAGMLGQAVVLARP
jgi:hypothetical protein